MFVSIKIKLFIGALLISIGSLGFVGPDIALATSGACSSHGGVNCSAGEQLNGKVYCNDGWTDSSVNYDFMVSCKNHKASCSMEEWMGLSQKYNISELYDSNQRATEQLESLMIQAQAEIQAAEEATGLASIRLPRIAKIKNDWATIIATTKATIDARNSQINQSLNLIERTCVGLGESREQDREAELKQLQFEEQRRLQENLNQANQNEIDAQNKYLAYLETQVKLQNTPQYSCPSNLIVSGDKCVCAEGYVYNGSSCVTYTQACQAEYGINSYSSGQNACTCINGYAIYNKRCIPISDYCKLTYGEHSIAKTMNGVSNCDCDTGYTWNSNITSCMKIETEPIKLPPVSNPINQKESKDLIELPEYETSIVESEETKEMAQDSNENTQITPNQEVDESMPIKSSNLLAKIGDSIKGFFARIFKWSKQ
jgi:hypothetical protein